MRGMDRVADWPALKRLFTIDLVTAVNINTIPRENLAVMLGVTPVQAAQLAARREARGELADDEWQRLLGGETKLGLERVVSFAGLTVELTATAKVGGAREVVRAVIDCRPNDLAPANVRRYEP